MDLTSVRNAKVDMNGIRYTFSELLPSIAGGSVVICMSEAGERLACPLTLWEASAKAQPTPDATVNSQSSSEEKIALFRSLFRGRDDVYAKRWQNLKTNKSGYAPACKNEWEPGLCDKRNASCANCPNRELLPLTDAIIYRHLEGRNEYGRDVVGVYPMLPDETTIFLAVDFDGEGWQEDVEAFCRACRAFDLLPSVERSRSGNGAHVWFFFADSVSAADARRLGSGLLTCAMERRPELKMRSYDRLFPNQDTLPKGGFGNLIALPLQGQARRNGNSVFVDEAFQPYPDQWAHLSCIPRISPERLDAILDDVCKSGELGELVSADSEDVKPWERVKQAELSAVDFPPAAELTLADGLYVKREGFSLLKAPLRAGVKLTVVTRPTEDYKPEQQPTVAAIMELLHKDGINVIARSGIHQKYAVIDRCIVWYGSINFLSFGKSEESVMRFESPDIAGELLDAIR